MRTLESGSLVSVSRTAAEVTYHIHEKNLFYSNGFKVLQNNYKAGFVKCSKGSINGKIRLTYDVSAYLTLAKILTQLNSYSFLAITCSLLHTALALREIGFLQRENISIDPADIFIDKETYKTYLIYLPLNVHTAPNAHMTFEKNLRTLLLRVAAENKKNIVSDLAKEVCADLANVQVNFQDIVSKIEMEGLQTTDGNLPRSSESRRFGSKSKTYDPKPPEPQPQRLEVKSDAEAAPETDTRTAPQPPAPSPEDEAQKAERRKKRWRDIGFFAGYCVLLFIAIWVIAHYFSNSGLTLNFVITMVAVLVLVLLVPVLYLTRRGNKGKKEMPDSRLLLDEKKPIEGMMPTLVLKNLGGDVRAEFFIHKSEFVIGKAEKQVDGLIPFDKTIGDKHCKIVWKEKFYIQDLDSDYGTMVNGDRVMPGQLFPLYDGDKVQLSNRLFSVHEIR